MKFAVASIVVIFTIAVTSAQYGGGYGGYGYWGNEDGYGGGYGGGYGRGHGGQYGPGLRHVSNGVAAPYRNDQRQIAVNKVAEHVGAGTGTAYHDGVPGTGRSFDHGYHGYNGGYGGGYGGYGSGYGGYGGYGGY